MYLMGLMSVVAGTTDERDIGNVMKELPVTDEIKNGLLGADGLFRRCVQAGSRLRTRKLGQSGGVCQKIQC